MYYFSDLYFKEIYIVKWLGEKFGYEFQICVIWGFDSDLRFLVGYVLIRLITTPYSMGKHERPYIYNYTREM